MATRENARDAITEALLKKGWVFNKRASTTERDVFGKGNCMIGITYRLFGGQGSLRVCRFYGTDESKAVNWGVYHAGVRVFNATGAVTEVQPFTGGGKRQQIIKWIKEHG